MDVLYEYSDNLMNQVQDTFFRYLLDDINWNQRMLAIKGPRGSGKTTLMLQYMRYRLNRPRREALYITADHYWFYTHNLVETTDRFYKEGGRFLFIDEVHKYPKWSRELKNIYDGYPEIKVVFSSSSALEIYKGEADLSRRVMTYELPGLSFREFLILEGYKNLEKYSLNDILTRHEEITPNIIEELKHPLPLFKNYLEYGYLPFYLEGIKEEIPIKISQIINTVIDTDLTYVVGYNPGVTFKIKKLLGVLAESAPFKPNISALARKLDTSRESIYAWLTQLENAKLLNLLTVKGKGVSLLQKPEKVYLENTNLVYALKKTPDLGSIRETFLLNQLKNNNLQVTAPKKGDFYLPEEELYIEVGGKNKGFSQAKEFENYLIAADDIEFGRGRKVPLWLFGFLY